MVRAATLCVLASGAALAAGAADGTCSAGGGSGCHAPSPAPFCPFKGHNLNHSGWSTSVGPFDLSKAAWVWEEPNRREKANWPGTLKVFHSSPMIDGDYNVYIVSTTGWVYSIDKAGKTRWEFETARTNPGNVAILGDAVFTIDDGGTAFGIDKNTGKELWRNKVARGAPDDTHSLVAHDGLVLTSCSPKGYDGGWGRPPTLMSEAVCALDAKDGQVRWIFDQVEHSGRMDALTVNQLVAIVGDSAVFGDDFGALWSVAIQDGSVRWYSEAVTSLGHMAATQGMLPWGTTATSVVGADNKVYHAFNYVNKHGVVRAHNVATGGLVWERNFYGTEVNAAVAVGKLYGWGDTMAVVVGVGVNPYAVSNPIDSFKYMVGLRSFPSPVVALKAGNGDPLWKFDLSYDGFCAGSYESADATICMPDVWGTPTIGADGTVYMNWSGGKAFAIRDANGDGVIDPKDPKEVSSYHHGFGSNGATALAPGFAVAPSCMQVVAFSS